MNLNSVTIGFLLCLTFFLLISAVSNSSVGRYQATTYSNALIMTDTVTGKVKIVHLYGQPKNQYDTSFNEMKISPDAR